MSSKSAAGRRRLRAVAPPAPAPSGSRTGLSPSSRTAPSPSSRTAPSPISPSETTSPSSHSPASYFSYSAPPPRALPSPPSSYHFPSYAPLHPTSRAASSLSSQNSLDLSPPPSAHGRRPESPYQFNPPNAFAGFSPSRGYPSPPLSEISEYTSVRKLSSASQYPPPAPIQTISELETIQPLRGDQGSNRSKPPAPVFYPPGRSASRPSTGSPMKIKFGKKKKQTDGSLESPQKPQSRFKALLSREKKKRKQQGLSLTSLPPVPPLPTGGLTPKRSLTPLGEERFVEIDTWLKKHDTKVHPYPTEAPYPQGYDEPMLENDRHSDMLLSRLRSGSPLFCDPGSRPPRTVLDLGCGQGHWVLEAARTWECFGTSVIGFDLMDLTKGIWPPASGRRNFKLVRGNFLKDRLPFPEETFDLVRMANLALCIPYDQWYFVLSEVSRVLSYGGRLELIDDEIIFPYGKDMAPTSPSPAPKINIPIPSSSFSLRDSVSVESHGDEDPYGGCCLSDADAVTPPSTFSSLPPRPGTAESASSRSRSSKDSQVAQRSAWDIQAAASQGLEIIFENMLQQRLGIHPRPSEFLLDVIKAVFGRRRAGLLKSLHLKLAPSELDWRRAYGRGSSSGYPSPSSPSHIPHATLAAAAAAVSSRRPSEGSGPLSGCPGLVLWPTTFIPIPTAELEMHANKHANVLLGCKPAIADFVELNEEGTRVVDEEFWDALWDYQTFIKDRFNRCQEGSTTASDSNGPQHRRPRDSMTSEISQDMHQYQSMLQDSFEWHASGEDSPIEGSLNAPRLNVTSMNRPTHHLGFNTDISDARSFTSNEVPPYTREDLPHIRTIRVYEAIKTKDVGF